MRANIDDSVKRLPFDLFRATKFFASLDGLRALSIIGVIWLHTWIGTPQMTWFLSIPVLHNGDIGVQVFFAISGFLITTLLLRERDKHGDISLAAFYTRRALRIWPVYYGVLGLYILLVLATERSTHRGSVFFYYLPGYLTYTYTWFPGIQNADAIFNFAWSLSTEEQFYLFWPFVIRQFRGAVPLMIMGSLIVLRYVAGTEVLSAMFNDATLPGRIVLSISMPICSGALLAIGLHSRRWFAIIYRIAGHRLSAPLWLVAVALCLVPDRSSFLPLLCALPLLVASCVVREDHGLARVLTWRPLAFMGMLSYGMYLYNTLAVKAVRPILSLVGVRHPTVVFPFVLGATVFAAWVSYRYIESPFLALKMRFSRLDPPQSRIGVTSISGSAAGVSVHP